MKTNRSAAADKLKAHSARMLKQVKSGLRPKRIVSKVIGPFSPGGSDVVSTDSRLESPQPQDATSPPQETVAGKAEDQSSADQTTDGEGPRTEMSETVTSVETPSNDVEVAPGDRTASARRPSARHILKFEQPLSELEEKIFDLEALQLRSHVDYSKELRELRGNYTALLRKTYDHLRPWEVVQVARHQLRPQFKDYVEMICRDFRELHGDRHFGDDPAIMCGLARLGGHKVMLIGHHKGRDTKEKIALFVRPRAPGRLSQGTPLHEAGGEVRAARRHAGGHGRRVPRHRR